MDKAKMYERQPEVGSRTSKPGEFNQRHGHMFKRSGHESEFSGQPYLSAMPLPYPLPLWSHPLFPSATPAAMPQYPVPTQEQESSEEGHQQGGTQTCTSDKSESPEVPGPNVGAGRNSCQSASFDPNHEDPRMGGAGVPYNFGGGFVFPVPYPGQLDPLMVWMHHMQRQVAYLSSMSGARNGYQHPTLIPSNGTNQRGYIKIPAGISQKQSRLWEKQSTENMQLWATVTQLCGAVTRAEAEIFCQRGKISKLEDELQLMKARQDAISEALKNETVSPPIKRVRRKRTASAPVAILGLPASPLQMEKSQVKKARGLVNESDTLKVPNYLAVEERSEGTRLINGIGCKNRSMQDGRGNCSPSTVNADMKESQSDLPSKDTSERQLGSIDGACVVDGVFGEDIQDIHTRGSVPGEMTIETVFPQSMEIKQEISTGATDNLDRCTEGQASGDQALHSGNCNTDRGVVRRGEPCILDNRADEAALSDKNSELIRTTRKDDWLEGMVEGPLEGALHHTSTVVERSNAIDGGNSVLCAGERLEPKGPEQQTKEGKDIKGASPDELAVTKLSDYIVLYSETAVFKDPLI